MSTPEPDTRGEGLATRYSVLIAGIWLVFLIRPASRHFDEIREPVGVLTFVAAIVLALTYLALFATLRRRREVLETALPLAVAWAAVVVLSACSSVLCYGWGQDGGGSAIFVAVAAVMALPAFQAAIFLAVQALLVFVSSLLAPGWSTNFEMPALILAAGFAMWGVKQVIGRNVELIRMRAENESLVLDRERNRFARDVHDLLGHSLTLISVKSELAGRLLESHPDRAAAELEEVQRLSREALSDVREAVTGYRGITLPGEIARARSALDAAGVEAELPATADEVSGPLREVFAWTIREGVTNVLRHSRARRCAIRITPHSIEVASDEPAARLPVVEGNGLRGLRERAEAVGARVHVLSTAEDGFVLRVEGAVRP